MTSRTTTTTTTCEILLYLLLCVATTPSSVNAIFGGKETEPQRYPYAVSLQHENGIPFCGGSLIASDVVLSAAHCSKRDHKNWLKIGRRHQWNYKAISGRQILEERNEGGEYGVRKEILHPKFRMGGERGNIKIAPGTEGFEMDYDFMLVFLENSVSKEDATLVTLNSNESIPVNRAKLTVMGWGDTAIGNGKVPASRLMEAKGYVVSNQECVMRKDAKITYAGAVTNNELCADEYDGYEHFESYGGMCRGDSGGPSILRGSSPENDVQVGIVSWGACGTSRELPGVYARVSSQYEWIRREVCKGSSDPPSSFDCPSRVDLLLIDDGNVLAIVCGGMLVLMGTVILVLKAKRHRTVLPVQQEALSKDSSPTPAKYNQVNQQEPPTPTKHDHFLLV